MTGAKFIELVRRLGRSRNVSVKFEHRRDARSNGMLYYGKKKVTVNKRKKMGRGRLMASLWALGLTIADLEQIGKK